MGFFEWTANVIDSIAWPAVILIVVYWLREPLGGVLPALNRIKWKDLEIDLSKEIKEITSEASSLEEQKPTKPRIESTTEYKRFETEVSEVSKVSPPAAITLAWSELEREIFSAAHRLGMQSKSRAPVSTLKALNTLISSDKLSREEMRLLKKMQMLRNEAAHRAQQLSYLSTDDALEYLRNVLLLANRLRAIEA